MNAARRKELDQALTLLGEALEIAQAEASDERDAFESMPESLQGSERGERASAAADALESAVSAIEEAAVRIEEAVQQ